ncbi:olfactory receptor 1E16-like [Pelobates fuscus]|uniref:olfactory receptor 1E16-like n=1 Tax=Pelobates fuscus TaxID=191477 RepID=UPI002FE4B28B
MDNQTTIKNLYIVAFFNKGETQPFLFAGFFSMYLIVVLGNVVIITVIFIDAHLQTPMYIFLCNLSCADAFFTTITLSKLLDILLTGNNSISFIHCFIQMYFFVFMAGTEVLLLSIMAYDRYVAICYPLHYTFIMTVKKCILFLSSTWIFACMNACFFITFAIKLSFFSNKINNFFCDIKAVAKISHTEVKFHIVIFGEALVFGLFPFLLIVASYTKIISSLLYIRSKNGRMKSFSTCTSHFIVIIMFYGTVLWMYMRPPLDHSEEQDPIFSVLYTVVTPMVNPFVYSLRNKEVKEALKRIVEYRHTDKN